jgi:membrane associated rhomboid family serine protease
MPPIRIASTRRQADEWALVLTAVGIPNNVHREPEGWAVMITARDAARADAILDSYDKERKPEEPPPPVEPYPWMTGVVVALVLLWLFSVTADAPWARRGVAEAGRITSGEPWRTVTALTLHADITHVAGNALAFAVLVPALAQRFGIGAALLLLLGAGALGNFAAALTYDPRHLSVGASTAAFGAVGMLSAFRLVPNEPQLPGTKRWIAPVAGVVLLVTMGAGPNADLSAHAFGFLAGALLGYIAGRVVRRKPAAIVQWMVGGATAAITALSWLAAVKS